MDTLTALRRAVEAVWKEWEALPYLPSDWKIVGIRDGTQDRYVLQHVDFPGDQFKSRTLAHVEIRDGKIWILTDNTEEGIATALLRYEVPKEKIVLAFYPPALREMGEFAVA